MQRGKFLKSLALAPVLLNSWLKAKSTPARRSVQLVGLSNSGCRLAETLHTRWLQDKQAPEKIQLEPVYFPGYSAAEQLQKIGSVLHNQNTHYIFVSGLGGKRSTPLAELFFQEAQKQQRSFQMLLTLPFDFEGKMRSMRAVAFSMSHREDARVRTFPLRSLIAGYENPFMRDVYEKIVPDALYQKLMNHLNTLS